MKKITILLLTITFFGVLSSCQPNKEEIGVEETDKSITVPIFSDSDLIKKQ